MSEIAAQFRDALAHTPTTDGVELLPSTLARAGLAILPVDGVGLSVIEDRYRVPLGASDDTAIAAERLQFTVGEGPCLQALHDHTEIRASEADLRRRWPAFYDELARLTPYRSIAALPLRITPKLAGAIDLYFTDPRARSRLTSAWPP